MYQKEPLCANLICFDFEASPDADDAAQETPHGATSENEQSDNSTPADAPALINAYTREELISHLLTAMGRKWWAREDAIRAAARRLGYARTGSCIRDAFKFAVNGAIRRGLLEYDGQLIRKTKQSH